MKSFSSKHDFVVCAGIYATPWAISSPKIVSFLECGNPILTTENLLKLFHLTKKQSQFFSEISVELLAEMVISCFCSFVVWLPSFLPKRIYG